MYISCNCLKKYIKNADKINFEELWNDFTIRSAEIDGIHIKGKDISNVVVAEIKKIATHKSNDKYKVLTLDVGNKKEITAITSAKNVYEKMKVPCALEGGSLKGLDCVKKTEMEGVVSEGVVASEKELGISDSHLGLMDLDSDYIVGTDIKKYIPIDDIIIEIDNKSLTNRPDMWGHLGIARELKAICGLELLELEVEDVENAKKEGKMEDIKVVVEDKVNCNRYSALKIENITTKQAALDMRVMLYYCGMRSISLLVDLTNYIMLELGQPLHAFDKDRISEIIVRNTGNKTTKFTTLDGQVRAIPENTLMICNGDTPVAIAGIMGGKESEVEDKTTGIVLESANFDATCIRKSGAAMGLRTEAVARYEKKIDPEMTTLAIKRFVKLLKDVDKNIKITSNMADVYVNKNEAKTVVLKKDYLAKYMGFEMKDTEVEKILESLDFKVTANKEKYIVYPPTYRTTKDITTGADVIEEIARIYGYNNLKAEPLKLDLVIKHGDGQYKFEYDIKKQIATSAKFNEVHTYLWNQAEVLSKFGIDVPDNIKIINKKDNNVLRNDINLSLLEVCFENSKHESEYGIFEIGSVIENKIETRKLGIMSVCLDNNIKTKYAEVKQTLFDIVKTNINKNVEIVPQNVEVKYVDNGYTLKIMLSGKCVGYISVVQKAVSNVLNKKISVVTANLNITELLKEKPDQIIHEEVSKYPVTTLDYTIVTELDKQYEDINKMLKNFSDKLLIKYYLKDVYEDEKKKTTIRFEVGSTSKTLTGEDLEIFKKKLGQYIIDAGFDFVGR